MSESVSISLPLEPESSRRARASIGPLRDRMDGDVYTDLRLLVSELVADAVRSPTAGGHAIEMQAEVAGSAVRVELRQGSSEYRLPSRQPEPGSPGWGLHLVPRLTQRWGLRREPGRATVWWEMPRGQPPH
jgi:hypothetical protein